MLLITGILLVFAFIILSIRWYRKHFNFWTRFPVIPSERGRVFSGDLLDFLTFKTNFSFHIKTIYDDPKYRKEAAVGIYALQPCLLIRDPELIKSILIRDFDCFRSRMSTSDPHHDPIFSKMLFFARYGMWREMRTKVSPIFTTGKLKQMYPLIQQVGENLERYLHKNGERFVGEVKHLASLYTTDVIATTVFGISSNSLENPKEEMYAQTSQLTNFTLRRGFNFLLISFAPKLNKYFNVMGLFKETELFLRNTTEFMINDREKSGQKRNDMIDIFLKLKQEAEANGENMNEFMENLSAQTGIFLAGGFDTSSTTISNLLFELAKQPEVQQRLRQEIVQAFIEGKGCISYETINDLEYLNMVVAETLRMYPVFPMLERQYYRPHTKAEDYSLKPYYDFKIPEGMAVYISAFGLNYDPQVSSYYSRM